MEYILLTILVFSVRIVSYGSSFSPFHLWPKCERYLVYLCGVSRNGFKFLKHVESKTRRFKIVVTVVGTF